VTPQARAALEALAGRLLELFDRRRMERETFAPGPGGKRRQRFDAETCREVADVLAAHLTASVEPQAAPTCEWHLDDADDSQTWETQCGHAFTFNDDGPKENQIAFCGYCGKRLIESRTSTDVEPQHEVKK
jgi:hypothetical protein